MRNPLLIALDAWHHRFWSPDPQSSAQTDRLRPAVVITGASEGIGLALAERFAAAGHVLVLIARRCEPLEAATAAVRQRYSVEVIALTLDITAPDAAEVITETLARARLYADILVHNAGIGLGGPFTSHAPAAIARLIETNIGALTRLSRHVLPDMCRRGRGGILNIASLGGYAPGPNQAAYYASKAYVVSLTRALAYETRGQGVRICVVAPGPVETRFHAKMGADTAFYRTLLRGQSPQAVARSAYRGFRWRRRVILPGVVTPILALAMTVTPGIVSIPIIGLLLRRRGVRDARRA